MTATGTLGTGPVIDNNLLIFERSNSTTVSNAISGLGVLEQDGAGTLTLSAAESYSGATVIEGGCTLQLGTTNALPAGSNVVDYGGTLDMNGFNDTVGALAGSGAGRHRGDGKRGRR
jgi:autotransporter-associated beta strand protein